MASSLKEFNITSKEQSHITYINSITYYQNLKQIDLKISSNNIIFKKNIDKLKLQILNSLPFVNTINININFENKSNQCNIANLIPELWDNIIYETQNEKPTLAGWLKNSNPKYIKDKNTLIIELTDPLGLEKLTELSFNKIIESKFYNLLKVKIKIKFVLNKSKLDINRNNYIQQMDKELNKIVSKITTRKEINESKKSNNKTTINNNKVIYGKSIDEIPIKISSINEEETNVCIKGELFEKDKRILKNGKVLFILSFTDYTSSIGVKVFCEKDKWEDVDNSLSTSNFYKVRGYLRYDTFDKELVVMAKDINNAVQEMKVDTCEEKRVELHAHTKMSSMDGICSPTDIIKRAAEWGHKAIAITDHGVVQAYPEAYSASKKYNIKVIYGMEGYLIADKAPIIDNPNNKSLDQSFVIFDIETTGLSPRNDKITEIGAIKIENGKIIDSYSALVNPDMIIPVKITELTGITQSMVNDKPKISEILPEFLKFVGNSTVVAHNADFDIGFIKESCRLYNYSFNNTVVDTLDLSRLLVSKLKRHNLKALTKHFKIELQNHHRAVDDARATAEIFLNLISILKSKDINTLDKINNLSKNSYDYKKLNTYHVNILVKDAVGLKNLYKIVTSSHLDTFYKKPRITKSLLSSMREGLIIGTACEAGELFKAILNNKSDKEIESIVQFYDFLEVQPLENNSFMLAKGILKDYEELKHINKKIVELGKKYGKLVVATGDVHFLDSHEEILRRILMAGQGYSDADNQPPIYFKTTDEMLDDFNYLPAEDSQEIVIKNPNKIADLVENVIPIPEDTFPPIIEGADEDLKNMCYEKAKNIYGDSIPKLVKDRLDRELNSIISNGYAVMYIIAHKLVAKSLDDGYLVGSRGSVGSSFVATMSDITEVNPLPPHYVCPKCKNSEFILDGSIGSGADLHDKTCPKCGMQYKKDGHDIPFEVFLGFEGDKEPDIDLNFAGEYQANAHQYTEKLFGKGYVYRAGTIGTIADKTAFGFARKYFDGKEEIVNSKELSRLSSSCTGVKRTTGQHPGGIMVVPDYKDIHDFTPVQYPANDKSSGVITTHFDYHAISGRLLKLDILGHDVPTIIKMLEDLTGIDPQSIPLDDEETLKIFTSTEPLKLIDDSFNIEVGSVGIPEFGTKFVRQMLVDTQPTTFAELVRISGLSHGTDVWLNNAQDLVRQGITELKYVISTRDDIMNYLIHKNLPNKEAFMIMENVRKGKGLTKDQEDLMKSNDVPTWYIESCKKIKYMFPKAHAVAYVMMSFRIAYFKVHHPLSFYVTFFSTKVDDFDADLICKGKNHVVEKINELSNSINNLKQKEKDLVTVLEVVYEAYSRGINFLKVDLYNSDCDKFIIKDNSILPPLRSLQGVGANAAMNIVNERSKGKFLSIEDIRIRAKISKTVIETLMVHGCLEGLPEQNQLSLF